MGKKYDLRNFFVRDENDSPSATMPGILAPDAGTKKRKRPVVPGAPSASKHKRRSNDGQDELAQILVLETQILESRKHYRNIEMLLQTLEKPGKAHGEDAAAAVALCRVFCRLIASEKMVRTKDMKENDLQDVDWLKAQWKKVVSAFCSILTSADTEMHSTALTLLMRLVKEETCQDGRRAEQAWRTGAFTDLVRALVSGPSAEAVRQEFVETFVEEHDDVRYFTFLAIGNILSQSQDGDGEKDLLVANTLALLLMVEGIPDSDDQLEDWYGQTPDTPKHQLLSISAHKKQAQQAWLAIFRSALSKDQRKSILGVLSHRITPWFTKIELLMDFLTDSFNAGGATSLLALSGLFYLIQEKNLDYPQFYVKLYSLLDDSILHSKHRSRFFRLLDTFMSSTHLPSAMVASFIKRLSRLALHAPPGGIVVVVPWVYNMLKRHPSCTFMIHREIRNPKARKQLEDEGMDDPFDMDESDPMDSCAIDSSLWELETLQSHYHPNVATLAKIISEQFTKRDYNLEDFLDHSYKGIIEAELGKEIKKAPFVEFEIPKRIFTNDDGGLDTIGGLLQTAIATIS